MTDARVETAQIEVPIARARKFFPDLADMIIDGDKTVTRRFEGDQRDPVKIGDWEAVSDGLNDGIRAIYEVRDVRRVRVSWMTKEDIAAEGCSDQSEFRAFWDSIYGDRPGAKYADNPEALVIEFTPYALGADGVFRRIT